MFSVARFENSNIGTILNNKSLTTIMIKWNKRGMRKSCVCCCGRKKLELNKWKVGGITRSCWRDVDVCEKNSIYVCLCLINGMQLHYFDQKPETYWSKSNHAMVARMERETEAQRLNEGCNETRRWCAVPLFNDKVPVASVVVESIMCWLRRAREETKE